MKESIPGVPFLPLNPVLRFPNGRRPAGNQSKTKGGVGNGRGRPLAGNTGSLPGSAGGQRPPVRRRRGFTLMEVLVALTILSVALIALHQAFAANIYFTGFNRALWKAVVYSHNELLRFERLPPPPISINQGEFQDDHPLAGYRWKREIVDETPLPGIKVRRVQLEIGWDEGNHARSYKAEIYVAPR